MINIILDIMVKIRSQTCRNNTKIIFMKHNILILLDLAANIYHQWSTGVHAHYLQNICYNIRQKLERLSRQKQFQKYAQFFLVRLETITVQIPYKIKYEIPLIMVALFLTSISPIAMA